MSVTRHPEDGPATTSKVAWFQLHTWAEQGNLTRTLERHLRIVVTIKKRVVEVNSLYVWDE